MRYPLFYLFKPLITGQSVKYNKGLNELLKIRPATLLVKEHGIILRVLFHYLVHSLKLYLLNTSPCG